MMYTLTHRITVANRSDQALRNISVWAHIAGAQRGEANLSAYGKGAPAGTIERLGPRQSQTLETTSQLPMAQVKAIRQGKVPVFIPLIHVTLEGPQVGVRSSSFVVGTPSDANAMRLHPIALDTPPGSIQGLRANLIKPFVVDEPL